MHPRKKTGLQGQEEKAVCVEEREKSREKGQEEQGETRMWGPSQSSFPDLLSGRLLQHLHLGGVFPNEDASSLNLSTHRVPAHSHPPTELTCALTHQPLVPR